MTRSSTRRMMAIVAAGTLLALAQPAPCSESCPADINGDNEVNVNDLLTVISTWGSCPEQPAPCPGNITNSGRGSHEVDVNDLLEVITHWGTCP